MICTKIFKRIAITVFIIGFSCIPYQVEAAKKSHTGIVQETINGGGYTYIQIKEDENEFWIAAPKTSVTKGEKVSFTEEGWMHNFKSKALNRVFTKILFVGSVHIATSNSSEVSTHKVSSKKAVPVSEFTPKPDGIYTVEEIYSMKQGLKGQLVKVHGEVVKVLNNIMGRSWVHITDGTGGKDNNKIIFRTQTTTPAVGEEVTAQGILEVDKDFGFGYFYSVIVEDATFSK